MSSFTMRINDTTITFQCDSHSGKATPISRVAEATPPTMDPKVKEQHVSFIREGLKTIEEAKGRDAKAACAKMLYDYMGLCAMEFLKTHEKFKLTVIDKAYGLKKEAPEFTSMVASLNKVLTALDQPLEKPVTQWGSVLPGSAADTTAPRMLARQVACGGTLTYCGCPGCPDNTVKEAQAPVQKPANTVVEPAKSVVEPVKSVVEPAKELPKKEDDSAIELALFIALADKYQHKRAIAEPKLYLTYFKSALRWGSVKGSTRAEQMDDYFNRYSEKGQREALMRDIFAKHKLVFSDAVMPFYCGWETTYKPAGKSNRYIKMNEFALANKSLFAPIAK